MGFDGLRIRRLGVRTLPAGIAPAVAGPALSEFLGADPTYQPFGAQLIHWDDDRHAFSEGWSRSVIVEDGTWRLAAIRIADGSIAWTVELGGPMYNSGISAVQLDPDGRATIGTVFGVVRVDQS